MKKLFFAALLATVAVGGAFATSSVQRDPGGPFFLENSDDEIFCEGGAPLCSATYNEGVYYNTSDSEGQNPENIENLSLYTHE